MRNMPTIYEKTEHALQGGYFFSSSGRGSKMERSEMIFPSMV